MYTFDQLKEDVRKEAEALKVHATKEELGKLRIRVLMPDNPNKCIYGLMCGDCYNERAEFLKNKCTMRYVSCWVISNATVIEGEGMIHYSPIEAYILQPQAKSANLIAFLKGESETLEL